VINEVIEDEVDVVVGVLVVVAEEEEVIDE
jgi:hypothetical protein